MQFIFCILPLLPVFLIQYKKNTIAKPNTQRFSSGFVVSDLIFKFPVSFELMSVYNMIYMSPIQNIIIVNFTC